ncbi:extracellular solute-binding protein [Salipiger sp. P9]|uniref:extracellular solute-binding protein n=1 Tax=Salipiger pentaromativorans TaxID=2943193 RepID=UPI0021579268|nr:extracellular solute-binding protein [Salipiger pentaromativorans]MCR8548156.1 extracellular solute-binding protein [Salipiger pentaromativorans]
MTDRQDLMNPRPSRRRLLKLGAAALAAPLVSRAGPALAQAEPLAGSGEVVVFTYGGSMTEGLRNHVFNPFTEATGIEVVDVTADLAESQVQAMFQSGKVEWDTALIRAMLYPQMSAEGMFADIDYGLWDAEALQGVPEDRRPKDAVVAFSPATLFAYDTRVFSGEVPQTWADFWDVEKFPGPRGLYAQESKQNIEAALQADGMASSDIYPLTDDKLARAYAKLDEIRPHVSRWWAAGGEGPQLIANREYVMSSCPDGRAIAAINNGAPLGLSWKGAHIHHNYMTILEGGPNTTNAQKLLAYINRAKVAAAWTQGTGFASSNRNQLEYLPAELSAMLGISPENASDLVIEDSAWMASMRADGKTNADYLQERWLEWRSA